MASRLPFQTGEPPGLPWCHLSLSIPPSLLGALVSSFMLTALDLWNWLLEDCWCQVWCHMQLWHLHSCMSGHLSHGTVESWPECGPLLQHHLLVLPQNVVYSMLCFSAFFFFFSWGRWNERAGAIPDRHCSNTWHLLVWFLVNFSPSLSSSSEIEVLVPILQINDDYMIYCMWNA